MNMNISIDFSNIKLSKNGIWIKKTKLENYMIPTFTKKIFASIKHNKIKKVAIIGGGISGLYIANLLRTKP